jgi:hypothetical protein
VVTAGDERRHAAGSALVAALAAVLVAVVLGAAVADLARTQLGLARLRRAAATALAAVDGCAAEVAAGLPLGWDFGAVLLGPDAVPGTADDGVLPTPPDCEGLASAAPGPSDPPRLLAVLEATRSGGRRTIEVVYRRAPTPGPPALVWLSDPSDVGWVSGTLGMDGRVTGRPGWASLAAPGEPTLLDAWLGGQGGAVTASADTGLPIWAPSPDLAGVVAAAIAAGPLAPGTGLLGSPPAAAAVTFAPGNLSVTVPRWAAGALVVEGHLDVEAPLVVTGLLVATGGVRIAPAGSLSVAGAIWLGNGAPDPLLVQGAADLRADEPALQAAAGLLALPHQARVAGRRDL